MNKTVLTENMIKWAEDRLGAPGYAGWVPVAGVLSQKPDAN